MAYTKESRNYRLHRFEPIGEGYNDEEECNIWRANAKYKAGFNPLKQEHPASDFPDANVREALKRVQVVHLQDWVDNLTKGFWMADLDIAKVEDQIAEWPEEQRAAYFSRKESLEEGQHLDEGTLELMNKIKAIWEKWGQMKGNNRPLIRSTAGLHRDFDINLDGMAHYGMLPDLLQDLRNVGLTAEDLAPLFRSANDYIEMWDKCEQRAQEVQKNRVF